MLNNPILNRSLPFQLPDFAAAGPDDYRAAISAAMAGQLQGLRTLREDTTPADVENVLGAWEDAGSDLQRCLNAFFAVRSSDTSDELDAIDEEFSPLLAAHDDAIMLDRALYARLLELNARIESGETPADEQDRYALTELLGAFRRAGVELGAEGHERLRALNRELAELASRFATLNRGARNAGRVVISEEELEGLTSEERAALEDNGTYAIDLLNTTQQPIATKLADAGVRRRIFEASTGRALSGEWDTRDLVVRTARTRAERARLLGYPSHAALVAEAGCAKTTDAIFDMIVPLAKAGLAKAREEAEQLRARYAALNPGAEFGAADWQFVEALLRKEQFDFDESDLTGFLDVEAVLAAVYAAAGELYGISFHPRPDLVGHAPGSQCFEVLEADGDVIGLFVMDFWARPTKQGGAWMSNLVDQSTRDDALPVVTNNCNYTPGTTTITWDGVITMFHEFGHALHGLLASSRYASRSGTNTPRDFVEFPSQVNEHWAWTPGRVLPAEWIDRLTAASRFGQGYATAETQIAAVLDLVWHTTALEDLPTSGEEVEAFERAALERHGLYDPLVPPRYRSSYFAHIWGGGYAASYYGYAWAEVMDADAVAWFGEQSGALREAGERFRRTLLEPGGSVDPMETWRTFRGRAPRLQPLLDRLGLEL